MGPLEERIEMPLDEVIQKDWRKGYGKGGQREPMGESRESGTAAGKGRGGKGKRLKGNSRPLKSWKVGRDDRSMVRRSLWKGAKPRILGSVLRGKARGKGKGTRQGIRYNLGPNATFPANRQVKRTIVKQRFGPPVAANRMNPARLSFKFDKNKAVGKGKGRAGSNRGSTLRSGNNYSKSRSKGNGRSLGDEQGRQNAGTGTKRGRTGSWNGWSSKRWGAGTDNYEMNASDDHNQSWDTGRDNRGNASNQWPTQTASGWPASMPARSSGDQFSVEDQRMMKKITIVTQLDKVPKPPLAMQGITSAKGKQSTNGNGGSLSLSNRFGANFSR